MTEPTKPLALEAPSDATKADRIKIAEWCEGEALVARELHYGSDREAWDEASGWALALEQLAGYLRASIGEHK
jgi:hypothetical protein